MSIQVLAQAFSRPALATIADRAEHNAKLLIELEPKPWRRTKAQNDAIDTFRQLAAYARRVIELMEE